MITDFTKIDYLESGNQRQQRAHLVLTKYQILEKLKDFSPLLAGTIPIEIDIDGSDLDIICEVKDEDFFLETIRLSQLIPPGIHFTVEKIEIKGEKSIVINFNLEEFPIEIFGQDKPTTQQNAYRHMVAEYTILQEKGEEFKQQIIELKKEGIKTEPAFGVLMNLENPYEDLLKF
ncbi:DUF4269 domain-containing protein [Chryseobacterium sp. PTM-20240506]|uniref:DUF4269 domain-containing protein n=1 Tax=unclassified Chryseobacterium TaxID=2593645 RepID=UPI00235857A2|nr:MULTISPECIES: DUF4269 domain-containing protein [unclassified Chryseobacterium]MDC8107015.1 DUF4269 domain-containing protein [Chryseobacterium sp. B21-037]MDQ1802402.1 DUF4269 domain-containing protein [Chryseobacterium sp. CKR4-1]